MQQIMIKSKKEHESMKETLEILNDSEMMNQIQESEENRRKGIKFKKLEI
ncbi:MAG TPA: hypothetical protein VJB66_00995 [Candidatus Nanoarchaeia archaeon]|nr:hypothetical protein [Candidatus Nanoarchaeia archaeon]